MLDSELAVIQAAETIMGLLSMGGAAITLLDHYQNRKSRRNLMSRQVAVLCSIDFVVALFLCIGVAGTRNDGFCKFQGFILQWGFVGSVLWNLAMTSQIYRLIVVKKSEEKLMKRLKVLACWMVAFSFLVAVILLADGRVGDATIFCWIEADPKYMRYAGFFWILLSSWVMSIYYFMKVSSAIKAHNNSVDGSHVAQAENQIRSKLLTYLGIFIFVWFFSLLNKVAESINDEPLFVTSLLEAIVLPSQGLLNAVFYGGLLGENSLLWRLLRMRELGDKIMNTLGSDQHGHKKRRKSSMGNTKIWDKEVVNSPRKVSIFATTFNQGEAVYSTLGDFSTWIKPGHDIYSIGVQECMCLEEFRAGLFAHLGGPEKYAMFATQIGSSNTRLGFHGYIALTVFIRTADIKSGAIKLVESASKDVASGANLIVTTAANKGAVGLLFHIHDVTIGFVTAHLPSDSKGKSKLPKRNGTAQEVLRELVLATDDLGCDVQHQHDYFVLMGDLNYRMNTPPGTTGLGILQMIAEAAKVEKRALDNDPNWIKRKYALMNGPSSPDFPSVEERAKLQGAAEAAQEAWDIVLLQDELRDMMALGEVYLNFTEPMPRFPPSYKRKLGMVEASCGDYSDAAQVVQGFSHLGEELPAAAMATAAQDELPTEDNIETTVAAAPDSPKREPAARQMSAFKEEEENEEEEKDIFNSKSINLNTQADSSNETAVKPPPPPPPPPKPKMTRRSSLLTFMTGGGSNADEGDSTYKHASLPAAGSASAPPHPEPSRGAKKRRTSVFSALRSAESIAASEAAAIAAKEAKAKSKIRPPSYTDRILTHALPDRADKLTVTSYDFADEIRSSDHRPVCMAMVLEVNSLITPLSSSLPMSAPAAPAGRAVSAEKTGVSKPELQPGGTNVILVALEMANLEVFVMESTGVLSPMNAYMGSSDNNAYMSNDIDTSDSSAATDVPPRLSDARFSSSRLSIQSTRDLESNIDAIKGIQDLEVAEVTVVFPLPCKDPMSVQRKMFDYVRALNLSSTTAALEKDGLLASMIRPASTVFPWAACALGDLQVYISFPNCNISYFMFLHTNEFLCESGGRMRKPRAWNSRSDKADECGGREAWGMRYYFVASSQSRLPRPIC